ncbi:Uncharacterised protein [Mobiluncus mulieris]|nr:Uncharacterised protein [Mobiluncus mulieris]SPX79897.1 Uncharacterised protein [Mobiluncus mulieris]SPX79925.1 Uncharacterised protein [Mobiluncus mulieris]
MYAKKTAPSSIPLTWNSPDKEPFWVTPPIPATIIDRTVHHDRIPRFAGTSYRVTHEVSQVLFRFLYGC